jgi:hypothetical protein
MAGRAVRTCSLDHFANRICNAFDGIWRAHRGCSGRISGIQNRITFSFGQDDRTESRLPRSRRSYREAGGGRIALAYDDLAVVRLNGGCGHDRNRVRAGVQPTEEWSPTPGQPVDDYESRAAIELDAHKAARIFRGCGAGLITRGGSRGCCARGRSGGRVGALSR